MSEWQGIKSLGVCQGHSQNVKCHADISTFACEAIDNSLASTLHTRVRRNSSSFPCKNLSLFPLLPKLHLLLQPWIHLLHHPPALQQTRKKPLLVWILAMTQGHKLPKHKPLIMIPLVMWTAFKLLSCHPWQDHLMSWMSLWLQLNVHPGQKLVPGKTYVSIQISALHSSFVSVYIFCTMSTIG
jgi:hypothetical protein